MVKPRRGCRIDAQAVFWTHLGLRDSIAVLPCGLGVHLSTHARYDHVKALNLNNVGPQGLLVDSGMSRLEHTPGGLEPHH